jgi:hypothetical protein
MASILYQIMQDPARASEIRRAAMVRPANVGQPTLPPPPAAITPRSPQENVGEVGPAFRDENIGQVGPNPFSGPPPSTGPLGEDVTAQFEQPGETSRALPSPAPPAPAVPQPPAPKPDDGRAMLRATAQALIAKGSPAQRVQGLQMLFEANQPTAEEKAAAALQKQIGVIDQAPAADDQKARARTLVQLGAKTNEIAEALGFDDKGEARRKEDAAKQTQYLTKVSGDAYEQSVLKTAASDAFKIIDESWAATGYPGAIASSMPVIGDATAAGKLESALAPIKAITGFDRLQQMREESKTGGALGSITERELRFLQSTQGSLDITQDSELLKRNIGVIVKAQDIFAAMRRLAPGVDAGDPKSLDTYVKLSAQLGQLGTQVKTPADALPVPGDERGTAFEQKYGGR